MSDDLKRVPASPEEPKELVGFGNLPTAPAPASEERDPRFGELDALIEGGNHTEEPSKRKRRKWRRRARKATDGNAMDSRIDTQRLQSAIQSAQDAARQILQGQGPFSRNEALRIVAVIRSVIVPRSQAGRKRDERITAAYCDWKNGMRGVQLYRKHIPGYDRMGEYKREVKVKRLRDAIRSRRRRDR
jgi:hypothetical protein